MKSFEKIIFVNLFCLFASNVYSTVGENHTIDSVYYCNEKKELRYIYNTGYFLELRVVSMEEKTKKTVFSTDTEEFTLADSLYKLMRQNAIKLSYVHLSSADLEVKNSFYAFDKDIPKMDENELEEAFLYPGNPLLARWNCKVYCQNWLLDNFELSTCYFSPEASLFGYSAPGLNFIALFSRSFDQCYEHGYTSDKYVGFVKHDISANHLAQKPENLRQNEYVSRDFKLPGAFLLDLPVRDVAEKLTIYGATFEGKYQLENANLCYETAAQIIFGKEEGYFSPVYLYAVSCAKINEPDKALDKLEYIKNNTPQWLPYKKKVIEEKEFDKLREMERYKEIMKE